MVKFVMKFVKLQGSHYDIGWAFGKRIRGFKAPFMPSPAEIKIAKENELIVVNYFPEYLDEIRGLAEGAGLDYLKVLAYVLGISMNHNKNAGDLIPKCSVFVATDQATEDGKPILGRNYDWRIKYRRFGTTFYTKPSKGHTSIGNCDYFIAREDGTNEYGLTIAMSGGVIKEVGRGFNEFLLIRVMLEHCKDIYDAIKLAHDLPRAEPTCISMCDSNGEAAVIKSTPTKFAIRFPEDDLLVATNHFLCPKIKKLERSHENPRDSEVRYARIERMLKDNYGKINVNIAKQVLSDHVGHVCCHAYKRTQGEIPIATNWSLVAKPAEKEILIASGNPCIGKYKRYLLRGEEI